jgi:hypothetical protein
MSGVKPPVELATLKANHGSKWNAVNAMQLLSGRRGALAAECAS